MNEDGKYLLDSDVFIQAKNSYYAFGICPGFWQSLLGCHGSGDVYSVDIVAQELLRGNDDLSDWVSSQVPESFFLNSQEEDVRNRYREIMLRIQRNAQYFSGAKADFATGADAWLIAYASVRNLVVITQEQRDPNVKRKVPIPNVCEEFGVPCKDIFLMLNDLAVQFEWKT